MKKKLSIVLGIMLVLIIGISVVIGNMVADNLVYQNKGNDTISNSRLQLEAWEFNLEAFEKKYPVTALTITNNEGYTIPTYLLGQPSLKENSTVILVHGLGGDHVSVYPQAQMYIKLGYNVIAIDQRASGISSDKRLSMGYYEMTDIKEIVTYIKTKYPNERIVLHGISMGGASVGLYASTPHAQVNVDAVILDSTFDSFKNVFIEVWDHMGTGIPAPYAVFTGNIGLKIKYGYGFKDIDLSESIGSLEAPLLIIQGLKDDLATPEMGSLLYQNAGSQIKTLWQVESEHVKAIIDYPQAYENKIMEFLNEIKLVSKGSN